MGASQYCGTIGTATNWNLPYYSSYGCHTAQSNGCSPSIFSSSPACQSACSIQPSSSSQSQKPRYPWEDSRLTPENKKKCRDAFVKDYIAYLRKCEAEKSGQATSATETDSASSTSQDTTDSTAAESSGTKPAEETAKASGTKESEAEDSTETAVTETEKKLLTDYAEIAGKIYTTTDSYSGYMLFSKQENMRDLTDAVAGINKDNIIEVILSWDGVGYYNNGDIGRLRKETDCSLFERIKCSTAGDFETQLEKHLMLALYERAKQEGFITEAEAMKTVVETEFDSWYISREKICEAMEELSKKIIDKYKEQPKSSEQSASAA